MWPHEQTGGLGAPHTIHTPDRVPCSRAKQKRDRHTDALHFGARHCCILTLQACRHTASDVRSCAASLASVCVNVCCMCLCYLVVFATQLNDSRPPLRTNLASSCRAGWPRAPPPHSLPLPMAKDVPMGLAGCKRYCCYVALLLLLLLLRVCVRVCVCVRVGVDWRAIGFKGEKLPHKRFSKHRDVQTFCSAKIFGIEMQKSARRFAARVKTSNWHLNNNS